MHYSLKRAATWNIAGYAYLIVASFVSTRWLVDGLGYRDLAVFILLAATVNFLSSLDLGLAQAVIRLLARAQGEVPRLRRIWSTARVLFTVDALVVALIAHGIGTYFLPGNPAAVLSTDTWAFMTALLGLYGTFAQAEGRFDLYNIRTFVVGTANTVGVGWAALSGVGLPGLVLIQVLATTVTIIVYDRQIAGKIGKTGPVLDRATARELLSFGLKNQLGKLVGQGQAQYGKYILTFLSPLAVSAYGIARGVVMNLAGGVAQIATALYPAGARDEKTAVIRSLYHRLQISLTALSIGGLVCYRFFGFAFLTWWLGDTSLVATVHEVLTILGWYLAVLLLTPLASVMLDSHGHPGITSFFASVTVTLEIILAFILLPRYGVLAPPIAALISVVLTTPALLIRTEQVIRSGTISGPGRRVK